MCAGTGSVVAGMEGPASASRLPFPSLAPPLPPPTPSTRSFVLSFPSTSARQAQRASAPKLAAHCLHLLRFALSTSSFFPSFPSSRLDFLLAPPLPLPFSLPLPPPFASPTIFATFLHSPLSPLPLFFSRSLSLSRVASFATSLGLVAFASRESVRPTYAALPAFALANQRKKSHDNGKRKSNNKKEDQIYFEVLEGAISWRYLPKFLISVLFFRRFFCFIALFPQIRTPKLNLNPHRKRNHDPTRNRI